VGEHESAVPEVTVVIPARNEESTILACLQSVLEQEFSDLEVIVVDNGSTDRTVEAVRACAQRDRRVRLLVRPEPSIPASMNAALAAARGRWLIRVDAHSRIMPGYLDTAVGHLRTGRWIGVGGRKDAVAHTPTGQAIAGVLRSPLAVGGSTYHHGTTAQPVDHIPFGCYPVEALRRAGGWDEAVANNEDFEMDQRLRREGELLFDPALRIEWRGRERISDFFRQYRRYGTGKPAVALAHPGSVRIRHLAPPALVGWLALSVAVGVRHPGLAAVAVAPYAVGVAGASAMIARRLPATARRTDVPAALVAMQVGWGIGFWQGVGRQVRATWR
jgi:succinoglycan biosynthesis protein ExoA